MTETYSILVPWYMICGGRDELHGPRLTDTNSALPACDAPMAIAWLSNILCAQEMQQRIRSLGIPARPFLLPADKPESLARPNMNRLFAGYQIG